MSFEDSIASLNEYFFFRELMYSNATFHKEPGEKVEFADNLLWLGSAAVVYQLKERAPFEKATADSEERWFERKIIGNATRQIRDTLQYIQKNAGIRLKNRRGHEVLFEGVRLKTIHKVVVYLPNEELPKKSRLLKYHLSRTAGIIHLIPANDYLGIVTTLITPAEFVDYLEYRSSLVTRWPQETADLSEPVLMGHYLCGNLEERPEPGYRKYLADLNRETETWSMSKVINSFIDKVNTGRDATEYYPIISAIAELKRNELAEFKKRLVHAINKAKANEFAQPYRIVTPRTGCGFIFIPLEIDFIAKRQVGLVNLTMAHKYDQRLSRCVGVSIAFEKDGEYSLEWCYLEHPWQHEAELERMLAENKPFRDLKTIELSRFKFRRDGGETQ